MHWMTAFLGGLEGSDLLMGNGEEERDVTSALSMRQLLKWPSRPFQKKKRFHHHISVFDAIPISLSHPKRTSHSQSHIHSHPPPRKSGIHLNSYDLISSPRYTACDMQQKSSLSPSRDESNTRRHSRAGATSSLNLVCQPRGCGMPIV